jgi:hypothetical protein|tara:strand:- start:433 stop:1317 length:885 start_codon:yes stop_codon:yes gene_type:complete
MKLGRKIRKIKSKILLFLKKFIPSKLYNSIVYQLAKGKFLKSIKSSKKKLTKSNNLDSINKFEFKITSQNNEDGIIDFLSKNIVSPNKVFFEIGFDFHEFNSLNLIKQNWSGTLIDGDIIKCDKLKACISEKFPQKKVIVKNQFIDYENINTVIEKEESLNNFDFFSLDTDGMDYWILESLNFNPKIICAEFNPWLGEFKSLTIPKKKKFNYQSDMFYGASLKAFKHLLNKKGYKLVAIESSGNNAFFIKQKEFKMQFEELDIEKSFKYDPKFTDKVYKNVYNRLIKRDYINIS